MSQPTDAAPSRYEVKEDDVPRMTDAALRKLRATLKDKRDEVQDQRKALPEADQYGSVAGSSLLDDVYYYQRLISQVESEMACRMLTLD